MSRISIRELMGKGPVIGDGAMATMLHQSGLPVRTCYEEMSLVRPESVRDVHLAYIRAGADVIQTNTFGGHRLGLRRYGVEHRIREINEAAVRVAREAVTLAAASAASTPGGSASGALASIAPASGAPAPLAGRPVYVFGTVGSTADLVGGGITGGITGSGAGSVTGYDIAKTSLRQLFDEQLDVLLSAGVDGIVLETFADLEEMIVALQAVRSATDIPVIATLSPDDMDYTRDGVALVDAFAAMKSEGADVVGLNCRLGLAGIMRAYENVGMQTHPGLYAAVPNAGLLQLEDGEYSYTGSADYFADMGARLVEQGVRFIGGCCGTTPNHIRKLSQRIRGEFTNGSGDRGPTENPSSGSDRMENVSAEDAQIGNEPPNTSLPLSASGTVVVVPSDRSATIDVVTPSGRGVGTEGYTPRTSPLLEKVRQELTIIAELDPPRTTDITRYIAGARALHDAGVDAITMADNSLGTVRVSNMALASILKPMGIEPLVHVACRDRNLIGQQSHLMGLHVLGIHHILLVTGDPSRFGDLPGATSVYDVSSIDLTKMVRKLNEGFAFSGRAMKQPARFVVGTSFNPHVRNFDKAIERLRRKLDAGADYVMTQPVYEVRMMEAIERATREFNVPVFIGIMPLTSARNALYIHHEVPGIEVPDGILNQMVNADEQEAAQVGLDIAKGLAASASEYFNGIYLVTPFLRYDLTVSLVNHLRG